MARTAKKTTTTKAVETEKIDNVNVEEVVDNKISETKALEEKNSQLEKTLALLQAQIANMQAQMSQAQPKVQVVQSVGSSGKKVKVVSLMHNPISVSTEPDGQGKAIRFADYGEVRTVKFDDLSDMTASYPNTFGKGLLYIADRDVVNELGLDDIYVNIFDKNTMDEIKTLLGEEDVKNFLKMDKVLQESMAMDMAKKLYNGEVNYDLNKLREIKDGSGFDILQMSKDYEESFGNKDKE